MLKRLPNIDPIAIALDRIEMTPDPAFSGVDLDTGAFVRITFERHAVQPASPCGDNLLAAGLVLVLTVQQLDAAA
ncbi:hypothetical protein [Phenylobacterium sp.]|uniref:hypothetical protein n=1 Tax=Phenylobacterium sp. TaxID=1871053 RepID=UPI002C25F1F1|nr:hypothetical protein [Phenylobacterium sp.]HLZ77150.1 hypothetical protein [Phenylobacterium sp.]